MTLRRLLLIASLLPAALLATQADAGTKLRNICRVKGQEENVLRGLGLVIGLSGTGEANDPATMRALARALEIMGSPLPESSGAASANLTELQKIKNVALVMVTAHVPATGARRGDKLDCHVSGLNGKSLEGGRLAFAALQGPNTQDARVFALCEGPIYLDDPSKPLVGRVHNGCQMEEDVMTPFEIDGYLTLVLDQHHANFQTATAIVDRIRSIHSQQDDEAVRALNAANIIVKIPDVYRNDKVLFISEILDQEVYDSDPEARVVINERSGAIVISGDVQIGDVVVSHRNVVVEAGTPARFAAVSTDIDSTARLSSLVQALDALKVPADDVIEIIKGIERNGKLHARLIIE
ncbi:MAG: flagellar basal body P-ring protein FlgI [Planctomycetales bacterium]|nr:flagellar basal body P-ring protein FlgI [Planctomycetales bacterium]